MRKRVWLIMMVLAVLLFGGCGQKGQPEQTAATTEAVEEVTKSAEDMTPEEIQALIESRLEAYESENPGDVVWPTKREPIRWPFLGIYSLYEREQQQENYHILSRQLTLVYSEKTWRIFAAEEDIKWFREWLGVDVPMKGLGSTMPGDANVWKGFVENLRKVSAEENASLYWDMSCIKLEIDVPDQSRIVLSVEWDESGNRLLKTRQLFWNQQQWLEETIIGSSGIKANLVLTEENPVNSAMKTARQQEPTQTENVTIEKLGEQQGGKQVFIVNNQNAYAGLLGIEVEQFVENEWREANTRQKKDDYAREYNGDIPTGETTWEILLNDLLLTEGVPTRFIIYFKDGTASWCEFEPKVVCQIPENPEYLPEETEGFLRIGEPQEEHLSFALEWYTEQISHDIEGTALEDIKKFVKEDYANHGAYSSDFPGYWWGSYSSWDEMQKAVKLTMVQNPLEELPIRGMQKANYLGLRRDEADLAIHTNLEVYGDAQGQILTVSGQSGYDLNGIRISNTFKVATDLNPRKINVDNYGSEFSVTEEAVEGEKVIIVERTTKDYYGETAHFVIGGVYYQVDVLGNADQKEDVKALLRELVPFYFE